MKTAALNEQGHGPGMGRVIVALVAAPFVLALAFAPAVAWVATREGLEGDALFRAVERIAWLPGLVGFSAIFLLTRALAARDGLSLSALGWRQGGVGGVALGLFVGLVVAVIDDVWLYPLVQRFQPGFDPTASTSSLPLIAALLTVAIVAEDTLYRGYALERLRARFGPAAAVVVTSVCYALMTPGPDVALKVWAVGFGVVLAALRLLSGNLWPVVIAHGIVSLGPALVSRIGPS